MKESEIKEVAALLMKGLHKRTDDAALASIREEVKSLCSKYPVYREYTH
jgi:glycine/serine hydroxymethyltransferase